MRRPSSRASYGEPFGWWGPVWSPPAPRTVVDLVGDGTLQAGAAGLLWALLARRASVVVVAGPGGAGKTTFLTALLDFLPPGTRRVYVRGCYEPFDFLADPAVPPHRTALLVNEISPHLPIYLWGPGVRRFLLARRAGFALAATAHATGAEQLVATLAGYPLRIPPAEVAALDLVVVLDAWTEPDGSVQRELAGITALAAADTPPGLNLDVLAGRSGRGRPLRLSVPAAHRLVRRLGYDPSGLEAEVAERTAVLAAVAARVRVPSEVAATLGREGARWAVREGLD